MSVSFRFFRGQLILVSVCMRHTFEREPVMALGTGARLTVITPKLADELGFEPNTIKPTVTVVGATGTASAALLKVASVSVGGVQLLNMPVICHELPPGLGLEGILGLNFLSHFNIEIHNEAETVSLTKWHA